MTSNTLTSNTSRAVLFLIIGLVLLCCHVDGAINTIGSGGMVFIGEEGLDITAALSGANQIGWWASGASVPTSSPDYMISISTPTNFYISSTQFGSHLGVWYNLPAKNMAFVVVDPQLGIRIEDTTVNVDVTDKWVPTDDEIRFRIDSNLVPISQRAGVTSTPITIKVQSPDGAIFTSLVNKAGTATSIVNIPVTTTPSYTATIWSTKVSLYPPGTYSIWAECNANKMNDNYGAAGKTNSNKVTLLHQEQNPLISVKVSTTDPVTPESVVPTTTVRPTSTVLVVATPVHMTLPSTTREVSPMSSALPPVPPTSPARTPTHTPGFAFSVAVAAMVSAFIFRAGRK